MYNLKRSNTIIAGLPGLLVVALLVVACRDSVSPGHRAPAGPEGWLVEPPPQPPPPSPPPIKPSLVITLVNNSAAARLPGCGVDPFAPLAGLTSTIEADVTVLNDPGNTITAVTVALGPENPGGSLCGTTTTSVAGHAAHFTLGVDFGVPPPMCAASLQDGCTYTLTATAEDATPGVSSQFTIKAAPVPT